MLADEHNILNYLTSAVTDREKKQGQLYKVFTDSFDAKATYSERLFNQQLQYIHRNPVNGKWKLVNNYLDYEHSSASFYETGLLQKYEPFD